MRMPRTNMATLLNKYGLREPAHWWIHFTSAPHQHGGRLRPDDARSRFSVIAGGYRLLFSKFFPLSPGWSQQGRQRGKVRGDSGGRVDLPARGRRWQRAIGSRLQPINKLVALLNTLDRWIDETPPMDQPSRFGNKAFRTWYAKLDQEAENLVATVVPGHLAAAVPEVALYLKESVGNPTRIDYGTGHEAAFAAFLCCLCKIGVLRVDDQMAIVFKVFNRYLEVMRKLQKTYRMEPAGSQGVWGLDDFQFLPFIWGSSQLIEHPYLEPRHFVDEKAVNENHKDYMFLECILFITEMKTGPFAEHSNQLWNISAVPSWSKVNQGLIRMYKAECLEKFPVIQHFKFGSLLPIQPVTSS
ncbi:serine/threonine-protein phosphatase 2A activator isoform X1 [Dromiciops gliroides]|uniref:serine/threonine-protein phosphatase 2A activator isoform X1 n=1 Tax=Dromiciops gliroides TaxID=33562 RepID=UPI001CC51886|nr:serine/threonine-protein phosphatase 2A activator isoform X1 [Dromiciops gliroides]